VALGRELAVLVAIMFLASLALWLGVPAGWLWVGSQVQGHTGSVGDAILVMMAGIAISLALFVPWLSWLNRKHVEVRAARGRDVEGVTALERVLVASGAVALLGFGVWFFGFSGSEPIPLNISY
jgi:uncharacterized iron-regulated membrane protein